MSVASASIVVWSVSALEPLVRLGLQRVAEAVEAHQPHAWDAPDHFLGR